MNGGLSQNIVVSTFCGSPSFFTKNAGGRRKR